MKVVMLGREAGLLDCLGLVADTKCVNYDEPLDDLEGDVFLWRLNEGNWNNLYNSLPRIKKNFHKLVVINTRAPQTMHIGGPAFISTFLELPQHFDAIWTYELDEGEAFCHWMGFDMKDISRLPSMARTDMFNMAKEWKRPENDPRICVGIYGAAVIRHFNYTAIWADWLARDIKKVVFAIGKNKQQTVVWCKNNVEMVEKLSQEKYLEELSKMRFCCYALKGRFTIEAQCLGIPTFSAWFTARDDCDIPYDYRLSTRNWKALKDRAQLLLEDDGFRREEGKKIAINAFKRFHPESNKAIIWNFLDELMQ